MSVQPICHSVFVTGCNRGIGFEIVKQLSSLPDAPHHIFAACRNPEKAEELQKLKDSSSSTKFHILKLEITNESDIAKAAKLVEEKCETGLNLLINNAGVVNKDETLPPNLDAKVFMDILQVNTLGPILLTQALMPQLKKASMRINTLELSIKKAAVINISSGLGSIRRQKTMPDGTVQMIRPQMVDGYGYPCSKTALNMATRLFYLQDENSGILFVPYCPGHVSTDMTGQTGKPVNEAIKSFIGIIRKLGTKDQGTFVNSFGGTWPW